MRSAWVPLVGLLGVCTVVVGGCGGVGAPVRSSNEAGLLPVQDGGAVRSPQVDEPIPASLVSLCVEDLARRLQVAEPSIALTRATPVTWPDSALGCPEPDTCYVQVLVPGYVVALQAEGRTHVYHTNSGTRYVYYPEAQVAKCTSDLAARLGVASDAIRVGGICGAAWPSAALGSPRPGTDYAEVVTDGFVVLLVAGSRAYEYHTDTGDAFVLCGDQSLVD